MQETQVPAARVFIGLWITTVLLYLVLVLFFPVGYLYATYENLYGEWAQFLLYGGTSLLAFGAARGGVRGRRWFWVLLGLAALYTALEEISWGQQVFGWTSPDFFKSQNLQGETNLHNFATGPYSTLLKDALTWAISLALIGYGLVYPLLVRRGMRLAKFVQRLGVAVPPLSLAPIFITAAILELEFFSFNEAEVAELMVGLAVFLLSWCGIASRGRSDGLTSPPPLRILNGIAYVAMLSVVVTHFLYMTESGRRRIDSRVANGIEKFAGRYARKEAWGHSIALYERHLAMSPSSSSRTRALAEAYEDAGDASRAAELLNRALAADIARAERDPWRASVQRSLVRTYRMLGDRQSADRHVRLALSIGERRISERPDSASAAYSLAQTYQLIGRRKDAAAQFARAYELKPTTSKYRKAYLKTRD